MNKTNINIRSKNPPRTVVEKYNYLKEKNPDMDFLKRLFDLEIEL